MPASLFRFQPQNHVRSLFYPDTVTAFQPGVSHPNASEVTDIDAALVLALTPSGTTVTAVGDSLTIANATARVYKCFTGTGEDAANFDTMSTIRYVRMWARRKPGTTGAITAQYVQLKGKPGGVSTEIGRISIGAVAASDTSDPVTGVLEMFCPAGHANWTLDATNGFELVFSSTADTDVEVVLELYGKQV